jgi:hypothetical protein
MELTPRFGGKLVPRPTSELGKLDEAEEKYQQCIAANPNDSKGKAELELRSRAESKKKVSITPFGSHEKI